MANTFTLLQSMTTPSGAVGASISASAGAIAEINAETIAAGTDTLVNIAFTYAAVKGYWLYSTTACTIETNSSSAPSDTITLAAGVPKHYIDGGATTNLFTANVTKFYITNAADTVLTVRVLVDPTP